MVKAGSQNCWVASGQPKHGDGWEIVLLIFCPISKQHLRETQEPHKKLISQISLNLVMVTLLFLRSAPIFLHLVITILTAIPPLPPLETGRQPDKWNSVTGADPMATSLFWDFCSEYLFLALLFLFSKHGYFSYNQRFFICRRLQRNVGMLHTVGTINLTIPRKIIGPRNALLLFNLEGWGIPMPTPIGIRHH